MVPIGVALVGCGEIAEFHARALQRTGKADIVAVHDRRPDKALAFSEMYGAKAYSDMSLLLTDPDVDAVYILTRHDSHADLSLQALAAAKHVFCEKPMAMTLEDAISIRDVVRATDRLFMVGFNHRWNPAIRWMLDWLQNGDFRPYFIQLTFATSPFLGSWAGLEKEGGGVLPCLGSHAIDLACVLLRDTPRHIAAITARLRLPEPYLPDTATVMIQTANGAICTLSFHDHATSTYTNYATGEPSRLVRVELFGDGWTAVVEDSHHIQIFTGEVSTISMDIKDPLDILGIYPENEYFLNCLKNGTRPVPNETDGTRVVYLLQLAVQSAHTGCVQIVSELDVSTGVLQLE